MTILSNEFLQKIDYYVVDRQIASFGDGIMSVFKIYFKDDGSLLWMIGIGRSKTIKVSWHFDGYQGDCKAWREPEYASRLRTQLSTIYK